MICKVCGAIIRHNEEYCRKCGSLVINFKNEKNEILKNICVENNVKGKLQSILYKFTKKDEKQHDIEAFNKKENIENKLDNIENNISYNICDLGRRINTFMKENFEFDNKEGLSKEEIDNLIKEYDNEESMYNGIASKSVKELTGEAKK